MGRWCRITIVLEGPGAPDLAAVDKLARWQHCSVRPNAENSRSWSNRWPSVNGIVTAPGGALTPMEAAWHRETGRRPGQGTEPQSTGLGSVRFRLPSKTLRLRPVPPPTGDTGLQLVRHCGGRFLGSAPWPAKKTDLGPDQVNVDAPSVSCGDSLIVAMSPVAGRFMNTPLREVHKMPAVGAGVLLRKRSTSCARTRRSRPDGRSLLAGTPGTLALVRRVSICSRSDHPS